MSNAIIFISCAAALVLMINLVHVKKENISIAGNLLAERTSKEQIEIAMTECATKVANFESEVKAKSDEVGTLNAKIQEYAKQVQNTDAAQATCNTKIQELEAKVKTLTDQVNAANTAAEKAKADSAAAQTAEAAKAKEAADKAAAEAAKAEAAKAEAAKAAEAPKA